MRLERRTKHYKQIMRGLVFALISVFAVSPASSSETSCETSDLLEQSIVLVQQQSEVKKKSKSDASRPSATPSEILAESFHEPYRVNLVSHKLYLLHGSFKLFD